MSTKYSHLWHYIALLVAVAMIMAVGYQISRDREASVRETSQVLKNVSGGYSIVLPANWKLLKRSVSSGVPTSLEDDGRLLQAERMSVRRGNEAAEAEAPVLTVTFYEKSRQESFRNVLQRHGISVPSKDLVPASSLAGRPTMRAQVERVQTLDLEMTDIEYYIDAGNRLYDIGLAAAVADTSARQDFNAIASSFLIFQEGD